MPCVPYSPPPNEMNEETMSSQPTKVARFRLICLGAIAAVALSACGSDASDSTASDTTVSAAESVAADTSASVADTVVAETAATAEGTEAAAAEGAPAGGVVLTDGEAPAERTITVVGRAFEPNTLTIKVGDIVTFKAGDKEITSVIVGDLSGATVTGGLIETFKFSAPGTYPVKEDISGNTATIIVE